MRTLLGLTLIAVLTRCATAQLQPGDIVAASSNQQVLYRIDSTGAMTTFANLPVRAQSLALGVANRGFVVGGGSLPDALVEVANDGTVTTLVTTGPLTVDFDVDGEGNYLGAGFPPGAARTNAVFTVSPAGAVATVIQGGAPFGKMYAMGVETQSGDAIVVDGLGLVIRVTRGAAPTATTFASIATSGIAGIHARFDRPGTLLGAWGSAIVSVDPNGTPALTTLFSGTPLVRPANIEYEPATGQYLVCDIGTSQSTIYRFDPSTATFTSVIPTPGQRPTQIAVAGARHFTALNAPRVGQSFVMRASFPGRAGTQFVAALSFGMAGIPVPGGTVYLSLDALFLLSLSNAGIFSGFQGTLNAVGEATPTLAIPAIAGLAGLRFFGAAVAVPTSGPLDVSEPAGFTIR